MRWKMVPVKNVLRLAEAGDALISRAQGMPGMGLIYGSSGLGKSIATTWFAIQRKGVMIRAMQDWTSSSMLAQIMTELRFVPGGSRMRMVNQIIEHLGATRQPLFVDEADYLFGDRRMFETLRDLHDMSGAPVILVGETGIDRRLASMQRLTGRISQWVEFQRCDADDASLMARELCEVVIRQSLIERLATAAEGSARRIVVGLEKIERKAKAKGLAEIGSEEWGKGNDFFFGREGDPRLKRARKGEAAES